MNILLIIYINSFGLCEYETVNAVQYISFC